jgi:hypothetical protein
MNVIQPYGSLEIILSAPKINIRLVDLQRPMVTPLIVVLMEKTVPNCSSLIITMHIFPYLN